LTARAAALAAGTSAGTAARAAWPAESTLSAGTALALGRTHLLQLPHLGGGQDLRQFRLHFGLERRQFLLLIGGKVELFGRARGQQAEPARATLSTHSPWSALAAGAAGAVFAWRRTLSVGALVAVLGGEQARRGAERQREDDNLCFHVH
jgi:hypothetical protein